MIAEKFYTCKYDRAFKEIMLNEKNNYILKNLLEHILKVEIYDIKINNIERNSRNLKIKRKNLDALLTTNIGKIEIEVNANKEPYVHPRNMAYISDLYSTHTLVGNIYNEDTQIIQINFSYELKDKKPYRIYKIQDENKKEFVKNFVIYEFNMEYYMSLWYNKNEDKINKELLLIMMNLDKKELLKISKKNKVVDCYMKEIIRLNENPEFREYMSVEEDERKIHNSRMKAATELGMKKGLEKGLEKGREKEKNKLVSAMLKENLDLSLISKITELSIDEINNIKSKA